MRRLTRRRLLAAGAAGLTGALSGCSAEPENDAAASDGGDGGGGSTPTPTPTPTPTTNATTTAAGPELRYPDFTVRTARIADGIVWHATEWESTLRQVRNLALRAWGTVGNLMDAPRITENDLADLERQTTALATFLRENVVPHYEVRDILLNGNNVHVQQLKIASRRGDTEAQQKQLQRLKTLYGPYTKGKILDRIFRNGPIHAKLYDDLVAEENEAVFGLFHPDSDFVVTAHTDKQPKNNSEDGVPQHVHEFPSGHIVVAHTHDHSGGHNLGEHRNEPTDRRLYAYRDGQFDVLRDTELGLKAFEHFEPELTDIFGPVGLPERREAMVYATVNRPTADFVDLPLQIQRFDSPTTAEEAVEFLLSANVFQEGTEEVAGRSWRRVYYTKQERNVYAFLLRTGAYVTTLFPEAVAWGERVDWPGPFERTWIAEATKDG